MPRRDAPHGKRKVTALVKEQQVLALRKAGATYSEIAKQLGISKAGAYRALIRALKKIQEKTAETAQEVLVLELERLDRMLVGLWPQASRGHLGSVDRVLRIMDRRAKFLGLDAATKREITGPDGGPIEVDPTAPCVVYLPENFRDVKGSESKQ